MNYLQVTAAYIIKDEKLNYFLIAQRLPKGSQASLWELPGGKIEPYENPEECLKREIKEELNIEIEIIEHLITLTHNYPDLSLELLVFAPRIISGTPQAIECQSWKWITLDEIELYNFAEADKRVLNIIKN